MSAADGRSLEALAAEVDMLRVVVDALHAQVVRNSLVLGTTRSPTVVPAEDNGPERHLSLVVSR